MIESLKPFIILIIKTLILLVLKSLVCAMIWNNTYQALNAYPIDVFTWANIIMIIDILFKHSPTTESNEKFK